MLGKPVYACRFGARDGYAPGAGWLPCEVPPPPAPAQQAPFSEQATARWRARVRWLQGPGGVGEHLKPFLRRKAKRLREKGRQHLLVKKHADDLSAFREELLRMRAAPFVGPLEEDALGRPSAGGELAHVSDAEREILELEAPALLAEVDARIRRDEHRDRTPEAEIQRTTALSAAEIHHLACLRVAVRLAGQPLSKWHEQRARGALGKIESVVTCEEGDEIEIDCRACGKKTTRGVRCGSRSLCRSCRGVGGKKIRAQFVASRAVLLKNARELGLLTAPKNSMRRFGEKFLTLTAAHTDKHGHPIDVITRVAWIHRAFTLFMAKVRRNLIARLVDEARAHSRRNKLDGDDEANHAAALKTMTCFHWLRAYEWTNGRDGLGNPHIHVWLLAPYLPKNGMRDGWWKPDHGTVSDWWGSALERSAESFGIEIDDSKPIIVDVQEAAHKTVANELIKYLTKDIADDGAGDRYVSPEVYARVVEAFDSRRLVQTSRGFKELGGQAVAQCECGAEGCHTVRIAPAKPVLIPKGKRGEVVHVRPVRDAAARLAKVGGLQKRKAGSNEAKSHPENGARRGSPHAARAP